MRESAARQLENVRRRGCEGPSETVRAPCRAGMIELSEAIRRALNSEACPATRSYQGVRSWVRRLIATVTDPDLMARDNGRAWVHPSLHRAFSELPSRDRHAETIRHLPARKRHRTFAKIQTVRDFQVYWRSGEGRAFGKTIARQRFIERHREGYSYRDGDRERRLLLSARSLARWERLYRDGGADAIARDGRGSASRAGPSAEAADLYWSLRLQRRQLTIATCHRIVVLEAETRGWEWFETLRACQAWDKRTRNERAMVLNCEGDQRYTQFAGRYIELEVESFAPGEAWVGDDHTFNCWVRLPSGKVVRPVLSVWECWRSRAIAGFRIAQEGNEHSLLLAFADGADGFGLPCVVIADNGKNYSSYQWRGNGPKYRVYRKSGELAEQLDGIFALCGITPSWALPYNPNGKARLERLFGTLDDQCIRLMPSYCGAKPENRPEAHAALVKKAVEWDDFVARVTEWVRVYNESPHSGEGMEGRTPLQIMARAPRKRLLDDNVQSLLLAAWHRPVSIGRNGAAIRITGTTIRYGAAEPALQALPIGTKVRVSYDPLDARFIELWTLDYQWLCRAECNQRLNRAIPTEALRETMRERARERRALRKARAVGLNHLRDPMERATAALAADAARRRLPDPSAPEGQPVLVPVQSPLIVPKQRQPVRKAVGAEELTEDTDVFARLKDFVRRNPARPRRDLDVWAAMKRFNAREAKHD